MREKAGTVEGLELRREGDGESTEVESWECELEVVAFCVVLRDECYHHHRLLVVCGVVEVHGTRTLEALKLASRQIGSGMKGYAGVARKVGVYCGDGGHIHLVVRGSYLRHQYFCLQCATKNVRFFCHFGYAIFSFDSKTKRTKKKIMLATFFFLEYFFFSYDMTVRKCA